MRNPSSIPRIATTSTKTNEKPPCCLLMSRLRRSCQNSNKIIIRINLSCHWNWSKCSGSPVAGSSATVIHPKSIEGIFWYSFRSNFNLLFLLYYTLIAIRSKPYQKHFKIWIHRYNFCTIDKHIIWYSCWSRKLYVR